MRLLTPTQTKLLQLARDGHVAREIERREEARWLAEDDDGLALLVGLLGRLQAELERAEMAPGAEPDSAEAAEAVAEFEEMVAAVNKLIEAHERLAAREEDEAAGVEHRPHVVATGRSHLKPEQPLSPKQTRASSRGQRASADAAAVPAPVADGWRFGTVERFNQISLTGAIVFIGDKGSEEVPISSFVFLKSGLTNLFSGQHVEALVETRGEGRREIVDLKLSVASRRITAIRDNPHAVLAEKPIRSRYFG
jgi:hypothetical protein